MRIACLSLFICAALAQTAQPPADTKPAKVQGKVVNSVTGEIIRKADLTLTTSLLPDGFEAIAKQFGLDPSVDPDTMKALPTGPKKTYSATSDTGGQFKFESVEPGDYYLTIKHTGFMDQTYKPTGHDSEGRVHLASARELAGIEIRMVPQAAISGKVVDEDGDPMPSVMVTANKFSYASGHRKLQPADNGMTNDRGEFRLGKLPAGSYYLNAEKLGFDAMLTAPPPPPADGSPEMGYVSTYFPGTTDIQMAEAVEIHPAGDFGGFVIRLQRSHVVRIKGVLTGADGRPLKNAQLMLMSPARPGSMRMTMVNNPEGKFELANVSPGSYVAMTMQMTGASPTVNMQPLVVPADGVSDIKLGSAAEGVLQGKVNLAGDGKIPLKGLQIMLAGDDDSPVMPVTGAVDESGAFTLNKVAAAPHKLRVMAMPAGVYLKSILWNGRDVLGESLDLTAGVSGDLQVIIGTDGATIDTAVTHDDKPIVDATVVLIPEDPARRFPENTHSQSTDDKGHATFKDVPPGNYLAFAWENVETGMWFDPAFLKANASSALKVTVAAKDNQHVEVKLIPSAK
jgi:Carboxypeptidase regulatory-like domain